MQKSISYLKPSDLTLDINNPRFGELYTGSNKEDDLIEYLLFNESASVLVERFNTTKEFYADKPLLVFSDGKRNIVKDGNRRCAAIKALSDPQKYNLNYKPYNFKKLPVVIYTSKNEIDNRIIEEHTNSMFREWDRIAKAIEVFRQFKSGSSIESMEDIDSKPVDLIKLASFYYQAVKIGGDDLKKLLRKGRGGTGGKTTIFERLFKHAALCGYRFKNKPEYVIEITNKNRFEGYIKSVIKYLTENPSTTYRDVDEKKEAFFKAIGIIKTAPSPTPTPSPQPGPSPTPAPTPSPQPSPQPAPSPTPTTQPTHTNQVQTKPQYNRVIPIALKKIIDECYDLNELNFTNSKIAMSRVVFECCLKYVAEETKFNNKLLKDYAYFSSAFPQGQFTNFTKLKNLFQELVKNTGKKQAFKNFSLETPHQIIHNYNIAGLINEARTLCGNLVPLIEFMLESESNLLLSIDTQKL